LETAHWADTCKRSLWWFVRYCYNIDGHPEGGWLRPSVHKRFCVWLQKRLEDWLANRNSVDEAGEPNTTQVSIIIIVPREFGKTNIITRAAMMWLQLQNPELSICIGSESKEKAAKFMEPIKTIYAGDDVSHFAHLYGSWYDPERKWIVDKFVHGARRATSRQDPSFYAIGVSTGATGDHPDVFCLDDPISYEKLDDDKDWFNKVWSFCASMVPVVKKNGLRLFVGTPYGDADHIHRFLRLLGAKTIAGMKLPSFAARSNGTFHVYFLDSEFPNGEPTLPHVWSKEMLEEYKVVDNPKYWAQVRCQPHRSQHVRLQMWQIENMLVEPKDVPRNLRHSLHLDTAFKQKERTRRGDWSCMAHGGHAVDGTGVVYFLGAYGSPLWRIEHFSDRLVALVQRLRQRGEFPYKMTDETEMGGHVGSWPIVIQSWFAAVHCPAPTLVSVQRQGRRKEARLAEAASYWVNGKVKLVKGAPGLDMLVDQMIQYEPEHDDFADAFADVFHPEVYIPERMMVTKGQNAGMAMTPFDEELKGQSFNFFDIRERIKRKVKEAEANMVLEEQWVGTEKWGG
jgi:hypothetical protein